MLVQRKQCAEAGRIQALEQEESAGAIARKVAVAAGIRLAPHQRLALRQGIGQQQFMVAGKRVVRRLARR